MTVLMLFVVVAAVTVVLASLVQRGVRDRADEAAAVAWLAELSRQRPQVGTPYAGRHRVGRPVSMGYDRQDPRDHHRDPADPHDPADPALAPLASLSER